MKKGYWVMTFRSIKNHDGLKKYVEVAGPVIEAKGGRVLAGGIPAYSYEAGLRERVAIVEFDSLTAAHAAYASAEYQVAVEILVPAAERDVRIVEGF